MSIEIFPDADALAAHAADLIINEAREAIRQRSRFLWVLAGGSTPEKTYILLAQPDRRDQIDWAKTYLFWGDERFVPKDDARSNYGMSYRTLISAVPIPPENIIAVDTSVESVSESASFYASSLASFFGERDALPQFDLVLLGLGDDGHTASLFPGKPTLEATDKWVVDSSPGVLPPPVDRITFTFPVINAARHIAFFVAGANKAEPLRDVLESHPSVTDRPAVGVQPTAGKLTWLLDTAAAKLLTNPQ